MHRELFMAAAQQLTGEFGVKVEQVGAGVAGEHRVQGALQVRLAIAHWTAQLCTLPERRLLHNSSRRRRLSSALLSWSGS